MAHRRFYIVGNWKMNPATLAEARSIFSSIARRAAKAPKTAVMIAPPAPFLHELAKKAVSVAISAQDVAAQPAGAFTGSVSAAQMKEAGADHTIVGHSERRAAGDTDEIVALKGKLALAAGLKLILCVGESERDSHARYLDTIRRQIMTVVGPLDAKSARSIMVAYEPVWAIGKSYDLAPKPADIHEMTIFIRKVLAEKFGKTIGLKVPVLYGGSVDFENAKLILKDAAVDGLLIGRQSLDPKAFGNIIDYAESI